MAMRIEFHAEIDSTQRRARELVERDDRRWDAVCADHQTAGRGRQGASWHDTPNQSLLVSLILWDAPLLQPAGLLGSLAALAAAHALERHYPDLPPVQLKYPNDMIVQERKLGGVLAEIVESAAIVGIGINLTQTEFPPELASRAISVRAAGGTLLSGGSVSRAERAALITAIHAELTHLLSLGQAQPEAVYTLWNARDCSIGQAYRILDLPGQPIGIALGIAPDFRLHLRLTTGKEHNTYHVSAV